MFKDFLIRKMMERQLKGMSQEDQEKIIAIVQKNPEFFQKMAEEIQAKTKGGMDQMAAAKEVAMKYQGDLKNLLN